jgi:hypothetical protein
MSERQTVSTTMTYKLTILEYKVERPCVRSHYTMGRDISLWNKEQNESKNQKEQSFRLARFGADWIIESNESSKAWRAYRE